MIYLIIGMICFLAFSVIIIVAAGKVQRRVREEQRSSKDAQKVAEKTSWLQTPAGKNLSTAGILTAIYLLGFWLLYGPLAGWLRSRFGCSETESWVMVTLFGLAFIFPSVWLIYSAANIPGDPKNIKRGMRAIAFAILSVLAYVHWGGPSQFFDKETGEAKFWVDDSTKEVIYDPAVDSSKTRFSATTGHKLRPGSSEDVATLKLAESSGGLTKKIERTFNDWNAPRIDSSFLIGLEFIDAPSSPGTIHYIVPKGEGWSTAIRPRGSNWIADPQTETLLSACGSDGKWKPPIRTGPFYDIKKYLNGATAFRYFRLPATDNLVPITWY